MQVESLFIYPLKSAREIKVSELRFDARGPVHDRRWMVVQPDGLFISQRNFPTLGMVIAVPVETGLVLTIADQEPLLVPLPDAESAMNCQIWFDKVSCLDCGDEAAQALSRHLQTKVRLVYADDGCFDRKSRSATGEIAANATDVSLADGYPLLVLSDSALTLLAERLGQPVTAERFRPNIVISGTEAHAEDQWQKIRIGTAELTIVSPCVRCTIPTLDPATFVATPDFNSTMATYRKFDNKILFGQNAIIANPKAVIHAGDPVEVLATKDTN